MCLGMRYSIVAKQVGLIKIRAPFICLSILMPTAFGVFTAGMTSAGEEAWKTCSTPKTQYVLQFPASLVHSPEPTATGCAYQTPDGEFNVEAVEQATAAGQDETIDTRMQKEVDLMAGTVTYQKKGETWFVLSGVTPDGTEYYRKQYSNDGKWVTLRITYPHAKNKKYDKWVTRIEKAFVAFGNGEAKTGN
ncbi:MAG: hypothetical protein JWO45_820 [Spartobacteria bacterium]|nr:hypothetical protein [Spartobacteria bacterium]